MNRLIIIVFCVVLSSCKKNNEQNILFKQLLNYRDELKMDVNSQEEYLYNSSRENLFFKRRFDSLNKINIDFEKSFSKIRYGKRNKIVELRDNFNTEHKLKIEFENLTYDENISDSIFNRIIEIDIYRLQKEFQNKLMFIPKESM
jgi:RNAse (barnase) inhibitor barstar